MLTLLLLIFESFICQGRVFRLNEVDLLGDEFEFLGLSRPFSFDLNDSKNVVFSLIDEMKFRCVQLRMSMVTNPLAQRYDTGADKCGSVLSQINGQCLADKVHNIQFVISDSLFFGPNKTTPTILPSVPNQSIEIPTNDYVKTIKLSWGFNAVGRYLSKLAVTLGSGQIKELACGSESVVIESMSFTNMERINGFFVSFDERQISDLDFFYHRLINNNALAAAKAYRSNARAVSRPLTNRVQAGSQDYLMMTQSNFVYSNEQEDTFEIRGPFGSKTGESFSDPYLYGHWAISQVNIWSKEANIVGIQMRMTNLFFNYTLDMAVHGNTTSTLQTATIPLNNPISIIDIYITKEFRPSGVKFTLQNGLAMSPLGNITSIANSTKNSIFLTERQNFVGVTGYQSTSGIMSLGFIVIVQNGDDVLTI